MKGCLEEIPFTWILRVKKSQKLGEIEVREEHLMMRGKLNLKSDADLHDKPLIDMFLSKVGLEI